MPEIETISWRELTGNKYSKGLESAMVCEAGYIASRRIRRVGDDSATLFNVKYDKRFLLESIGKSICKPLFVLGKERVIELVSNAWDLAYGIPNDFEPKKTTDNQ